MNLFPLATFDRIEHNEANAALVVWGHYLEACERPFGRHSFGLYVKGELVAVAISASTVNGHCAGWNRTDVVELARLCTHPSFRSLTRVALRLWREIAPAIWSADHWPVKALVSYQSTVRHNGNIYRFDGWKKVAEVPGSTGGGTWSPKKPKEPKAIWVYELGAATC